MTLIDVLNWMDTDATPDDLKRLGEQLRFKQNLSVYSFKPGDPVKFQGKRGYGMVHGVFVKHLTKNVEVLVNGVRWRVTPSLIQADTPAVKPTPTTTVPPVVQAPAVPTVAPGLQTIGQLIKEKLGSHA